jgi:Rrf2 family protein
MLFLCSRTEPGVVRREEIAREMEIPSQFLGKIAQQLARAHFIEIVQGAGGGYRLLVEPENLTLLEVVEAVTGEIVLNDCQLMPGSCFRSPTCNVHKIWGQARKQLRDTLRQATFATILEGESCAPAVPGQDGASAKAD